MNLKVNNSTMKVKLSDNAATKALVERLKEGTITYYAHDFGGFEKVGALGFSLPSNDTYITTEHFQTYKQGTLNMVKSLDLVDMRQMAPESLPLIFNKEKE